MVKITDYMPYATYHMPNINIKILPPDIISKIAAGEVVERPAAVVKEMLENSIDAGADTIDIDITDAGRTEIVIRDNGSGISKDNLDRMFQRHATSKIQNLDDLYNIHSLGFRGEALYSIAAIADVTLQTKILNSSKGEEKTSAWEIHLRGGKRISLKPCSISEHGTIISVKELFFNTPARRKFLKTDSTEFNQILSVITPYALFYPKLKITLTHNGKKILDVKSSDNHLKRVADILKVDEKFLLETQHTTDDAQHTTIQLILGDMNLRRPRRDLQFLFINGRPVQNKNISFAMAQAYRLILPPDEFPVFVAMIDLPPEDVDSNVHPTKREVKIRDERTLCDDLRHLCEKTLMNAGRMQQVGNFSYTTQNHNSVIPAKAGIYFKMDPCQESSRMTDYKISESPSSYQSAGSSSGYSFPSRNPETQHQLFSESQNNFSSDHSLQKKLTNAKLIGIFRTKYILFEHETSLLLMDQHAAAERINYEHLILQMEKGNVEIQNLLTPTTLRLTAQEMLIWEESKDALEKIGFSSSLWNNDTIAVHSHPRTISDIEPTVRHILAGGHLSKNDHDALARRACRCSIMTGDKIKTPEAEHLRVQLLACLDPLTCPHGRPTVVEMTENFLDKQFLRT